MRRTGLAVMLALLVTSSSALSSAQEAAPPPEEAAPPPEAADQPADTPAPDGDTPAEAPPADAAEGDEAPPPAEPAPPAASPPAAQPAPADAPPVAASPPEATAPAATSPAAPGAVAASAAAAGPVAVDDGADKVEDDEGVLPAHVPWRGTSFKWGHAVTTTVLGVGRDNQGGTGEQYTQSFQFLLNYFLIDQDAYRLTVYTAPRFSVEATNSDWTTTEHEPQFSDLPLTLALGGTLYKPGAEGGDDSDVRSGSLLRTSGTARMSVYFPTSPTSQASGTYLTTAPRLSLTQLVPVLGAESPVLKFIVLGGSFRWDHRFTKATTPVNDDLNYPRQTGAGESFLSDQLSFDPLALNTLTESFYIYFVEAFGGIELEAYGAVSFGQAFYSPFEGSDCEVETLTGCVQAQRAPDARTSTNTVGFSAGLTVYPMAEWGIELAYANQATQLGPDGQRRDVFYSPDAVFEANLLVSIDAIYERIVGPPRSGSYVITKTDKKKQRRGPSPGMLTGVF